MRAITEGKGEGRDIVYNMYVSKVQYQNWPLEGSREHPHLSLGSAVNEKAVSCGDTSDYSVILWLLCIEIHM